MITRGSWLIDHGVGVQHSFNECVPDMLEVCHAGEIPQRMCVVFVVPDGGEIDGDRPIVRGVPQAHHVFKEQVFQHVEGVVEHPPERGDADFDVVEHEGVVVDGLDRLVATDPFPPAGASHPSGGSVPSLPVAANCLSGGSLAPPQQQQAAPLEDLLPPPPPQQFPALQEQSATLGGGKTSQGGLDHLSRSPSLWLSSGSVWSLWSVALAVVAFVRRCRTVSCRALRSWPMKSAIWAPSLRRLCLDVILSGGIRHIGVFALLGVIMSSISFLGPWAEAAWLPRQLRTAAMAAKVRAGVRAEVRLEADGPYSAEEWVFQDIFNFRKNAKDLPPSVRRLQDEVVSPCDVM